MVILAWLDVLNCLTTYSPVGTGWPSAPKALLANVWFQWYVTTPPGNIVM